ncbi:MAG: hypothetical protein GTN71_06190 [Anaerolineae bacterium]|nr:hypothetical protein [Anaerolineae bacterium]
MLETIITNLDLFLNFANLILSSAIVITAFSLLVYIFTHNLRSAVARSFCALITFVIVVYAGDVVLSKVETLEAAVFWLKFQWIGIAFVPAAYLHFSDALLRTTNASSRLRRISVYASYVIGLALLLMAIFTDVLVRDGVYYSPQVAHLTAGPLFWVFAIYFFATVVGGAANIRWAQQRCLTSASRRRMTYLAISFAAPGLGVFPYLLIASRPAFIPPVVLLSFVLIGNLGVALMIVVMAYSVAYFGVLTPDRVIKHSLIHYLLRGPFVGTCVIMVMLVMPKAERILGLPRDTVLIFTVVATIVLLQILINLTKPFIDRLIYRQDREEITWIQELDKRLLTTTDLKQFLENVLTSLCELLRVRRGFVVVMAGGRPQIEAHCGSLRACRAFVDSCDLGTLARLVSEEEGGSSPLKNGGFIARDGYWLHPLRTQARDATLGILGVEAREPEPNLTAEEQEVVEALISQAEVALEDRSLQQGIFTVLRSIIPEIELIQRWRGTVRYTGSPGLETIESSPLYAPDFQQWVKDALSHYWGGPKLTESPLLKLKIVEEALRENDGNPAKALRAVLNRAIESLKPEGERRMTTSEWILYNILEMKFIQGRRVRDIAGRLAMSESDLYRKQRVAIEEVAKTLVDMEQQESA